jgi:hypothetical protein
VLDETPPTNTCGGGREEANNPTPCAPEVVEEPIIPPVEADAADEPALCSDEVTTVDDGCTCDFPDAIDNGTMSGNLLSYTLVMEGLAPLGATVTYDCVDGFELDVDQTMTCTGTGVWDNDPPVCEAQFTDALSCQQIYDADLAAAVPIYNNMLGYCDDAGDKEGGVCDWDKGDVCGINSSGRVVYYGESISDLITTCKNKVKKIMGDDWMIRYRALQDCRVRLCGNKFGCEL